MRVIGTVGLPGSGKGEAAAVAEELGIPVVSMGDVVRGITRERGRDPATEHGAVAAALRDEEGPAAIAERTLPKLRELEADGVETVLVDGIRSVAAVDRFEASFGEDFTLVSIEAPFDLRKERLSSRGREDDVAKGAESLRDRDERELGFGMGRAMDRADRRISNDGTLEEFREAIRRVLQEGDPS